MRGNVMTGRLVAGWSGLEALTRLLRDAGVKFEPGIKMESVMLTPDGLKVYQVNDNVVITLVGDSDSGYTFTITISADADTIEVLVNSLTAPGSVIENFQRQEVTYGMTRTRVPRV